MGSSDEAFCLKWNDFQMSIATSFSGIRSDCDLLDVTVQCGATPLQAHRLILSACSSWFRDVFRALPSAIQNPVIVLWEASATDMRLLFDFMYNGEVNVKQENLNTFLALAERLQVRGLTQNETSGGKSAANSARTAASDIKAPDSNYPKQTFSKAGSKWGGDKVPSSPHNSTPPAKKARPHEDNDIEEVAVVKQEVVAGQGDGGYQGGQGGGYQGGGQVTGYQEGNDHSGQGGEMVSYDQDEMYDSYYEGDDGSGTPTQGSQDFSMNASGMGGLESAKASFRAATSDIAPVTAPFFASQAKSATPPCFVSSDKNSPQDGYTSPAQGVVGVVGYTSPGRGYNTSPGRGYNTSPGRGYNTSPVLIPRHHMTFCTPCGRDYVNLKQHEEDCHGPNQQIPCPYCNKKFKSKNSMRVHKSMTHRETAPIVGPWKHDGHSPSNAD